MVMRDSYLYPTLEAGSSRVFNVCSCTFELLRLSQSNNQTTKLDPLFKFDSLNKSIVVKETRPHMKCGQQEFKHPVGTKIYFPYDSENIYNGGRSLFIDDKNIRSAFQDNFGIKKSDDNDDYATDMSILKILDRLPSLDPFLIKDQFQIEEIEAHEIYFNVSETEWKSIRSYVSNRLKPIITFAFQDSEGLEDGRTQSLLTKLWNTKDIRELMPIIKAFGISEDEASQIFSAWKGVMYYDYEYSRCLPDWKEYIKWLQHDARATDLIDSKGMAMIESATLLVRDRIKNYWEKIQYIFGEYDSAYDLLFVKKESPEKFIEFMKTAVDKYWILGTIISSLSLCVSIWKILISAVFNRQFKYEQLYNLLEMQKTILFKSYEHA